MSEYSILRGIARADIRHEPYAHVVVEDCLPARLYAELAQTFPADEAILRLGRPLCELRTGILDSPEADDCEIAYFRAENDRAEGRDLEIFQWKRNKAQQFVGSEVVESDAELRYAVSIPEGLFEKRQKTDLVSLGRRALQRYRVAVGRF